MVSSFVLKLFFFPFLFFLNNLDMHVIKDKIKLIGTQVLLLPQPDLVLVALWHTIVK